MYVVASLVTLLLGAGSTYAGGNGREFEQSAVDSCTENSYGLSYWRIEDFKLRVYNWDNGGTKGSFGFKSYYSATNTTVDCMLQDVDLAKLENSWSKCNTTGTEFQFGLSDISLTVKETWTCPGSPGTVFHANATGRIMMHGCLDNDSAQGVESDCNLMDLEMSANTTSSSQM